MKQYTKLEKTFEYDSEKLSELAEAVKELQDMTARRRYLEEVIQEHNDLTAFLWRTEAGDILPHDKIEDDHLKNILQYQVNNGRQISKELQFEAKKRGFEIPTRPKRDQVIQLAAGTDDVETEEFDEDDFDNEF